MAFRPPRPGGEGWGEGFPAPRGQRRRLRGRARVCFVGCAPTPPPDQRAQCGLRRRTELPMASGSLAPRVRAGGEGVPPPARREGAEGAPKLRGRARSAARRARGRRGRTEAPRARGRRGRTEAPRASACLLWGLRPHAPAGSAAPPKPRGRSGPLSPGERVGVRAHRGRRDASDLSLAACLSSFDGVCGFRAGAWGAAPTENTIEGGWASRAAARARPSPSRAPRLRGRSSPRLCSAHAGVWGAQPPTEKNNPGRVGGEPRAARARPETRVSSQLRGRASPREGGPSAARARYRRGSSLRLENCRRRSARSPGCGSPAARRAATAARPARARRGSRGTGPHPRRTAT